MIKRIRGRFEAHDDIDIELSSGLTTICGPNDKGKSAVRRMLQWVAMNTPRGDSMIPWSGKKQAHVTVETDLGDVTRARGQKNHYAVNGETFEALGSSVPEEVTDVLNLASINIQSQVDQYFLLTSSSGEIAKMINQVAGIDNSDRAIKRAKELIAATNSAITEIEGDVVNAKRFIELHEPGIRAAEAALDSMLYLEETSLELSKKLEGACSLSSELADSTRRLSSFPNFEDISERIKTAEETAIQVEKQAEFIRNALNLCIQLNSIDLEMFGVIEEVDMVAMAEMNSAIAETESRLSGASELSAGIKTVDLGKFENLGACIDVLHDLRIRDADCYSLHNALEVAKALSDAIRGFDVSRFYVIDEVNLEDITSGVSAVKKLSLKLDILRELKSSKDSAEELRAQAMDAEAELEIIQSKCPTCGQRIPANDINHIHS